MNTEPEFTREELQRQVGLEIRSATPHRPRLTRVDWRGQQAVVKDYSPCSWFLRAVAGPLLVRREVAIYRALADCPGVPRLLGRIDQHAFAVEYVPGLNAQEYADGTLPPEFFAYFQEVVDAIHARGVVHCDLKNRRNVVVGADYHPYLVDFTTAFGRGRPWSLIRNYAFRRFLLDDQKAVIKAKLQVGKMHSPEDARFAFGRSPAERVIRCLRDGLRWGFKLLSRR